MFLNFWKGKAPQPSAPPGPPVDVSWQRDERGHFHRLLRLHPIEAGLSGIGGVYVLWSHGISPKWIYTGATDDLGEAIGQARDTQQVLLFEGHGGVYVTWSPVKTEYRDGVAAYLRTSLTPEIMIVLPTDHPLADADPIAVFPPA